MKSTQKPRSKRPILQEYKLCIRLTSGKWSLATLLDTKSVHFNVEFSTACVLAGFDYSVHYVD